MSELKKWAGIVCQQELPIFRYTINAINNIVSNEDASTTELAQVILQDATLTARILRIANSATYNPTASSINTISRAIVILGFNMVRDLSLSLAIIDALLNLKGRQHAFRLMARSFHAAVQAKSIAEERGDDAPEEIFIAALLYYIGEMAFWCVAGQEGERILLLTDDKGYPPEMAQRQVLGFTFNQLTIALTQDWHLSDLLHSAINQPHLKNPRIQNIIYGHKLAVSAEKGWNAKTTRELIRTIAPYLGLEPEKTQAHLCHNAVKAMDVAKLFGASSIIAYLPIPENSSAEETSADGQEAEKYPSPDPILQLNILRDLSRILEKQPNINLTLETVLEGIYRGVGMDRTLFALLTSDKKHIHGKYALGEDNQLFTQKFRFELGQVPFFDWLFKHKDAIWIKNTQDQENQPLIVNQLLEIIAAPTFFAFPLILNTTPIGIVYADRQPSMRKLDADSFESFRHFCIQAKMAIEYTSLKKR
ncbi:MAG: HDOD domain-containing protein [Methylohalobius crimeensis]